MNHKPQKSTVISVAVSIAFHLLLIAGLYLPFRHAVQLDSVPFSIHTPQAPTSNHIADPSSSPAPAPIASPKNIPQPKAPSSSSSETPTQTAMESEQTAHTSNSNETSVQIGNATGNARITITGAPTAIGASLDRKSFKHPEYTGAALAAGYETSVVAAIFIHKNGSVGEIQLEHPLLHDMQPRLIQAIRSARFMAAQNVDGEAVSSWLRIRFKLVIPK